jgi:hypothetical protein
MPAPHPSGLLVASKTVFNLRIRVTLMHQNQKIEIWNDQRKHGAGKTRSSENTEQRAGLLAALSVWVGALPQVLYS